MTFDHKMIRFISWTLIVATTIIILVSALSTVISVTNKSTRMAQEEAGVMAANLADNFEQYQGLIWSIVLDNHIQSYLKSSKKPYDSIDNVHSVLDDLCNMWGNINFISIIRSDGRGDITKGKAIPNWMPDYLSRIKADYIESITMRDSEMKMSFTREFDKNQEYSLNIYFPLYSTEILEKQLGLLCININDPNLLLLLTNLSSHSEFAADSYVIHKNSVIIASTDEKKIGTVFQGFALDQVQETVWSRQYIVISKKLSTWNFYYIIRISWWVLLRESIYIIAILLLLLVMIILLIIPMSRRLVIKAYEPWGKVVTAMARVSGGDLHTRLAEMESMPDMKVVSQGFNGMMEQLMKLMEQVKEEQFQIDQIRMMALQAQIQPHFLYNTLDCIHWQAVVNGNQEISSIVKVLAAYYRTCLSQGKDIITLEEELQHIKNYLYIQKIRYEEILNYEIIADTQWSQAVIPKLTLQPLVENAIYHGIKRVEGKKGEVKIRVAGSEQEICIEVEDNGIGMSKEKLEEINLMISRREEEFGYGVRNVNRRLQLYYGAGYGLEYMKNSRGGITVRVRIPYTRGLKERQIVI